MKPHLLIALASISFYYPAFAESDQSIADLPDHIKVPNSAVALIADFDHPSEGTVPVYLVNRSGKDLQLESQDGDVYLKLEYQDPNGDWKRAQPHAYSWCGNSYFSPPKLRSERFMVIAGYQPVQGNAAKVRFRFYQQYLNVASNVGKGLILKEDVLKAENDAMTIMSGDFALVASVARGKRILHNTMDHIKDLRETAIFELGTGRFDRAKAEEVLREIVALKEVRYGQSAQGQLNALKYRAEHPE
jgi:hypothetical protein